MQGKVLIWKRNRFVSWGNSKLPNIFQCVGDGTLSVATKFLIAELRGHYGTVQIFLVTLIINVTIVIKWHCYLLPRGTEIKCQQIHRLFSLISFPSSINITGASYCFCLRPSAKDQGINRAVGVVGAAVVIIIFQMFHFPFKRNLIA